MGHKRPAMPYSTFLSLLLIAGAVWIGWHDIRARQAATFSGSVTWVSDGDTLKVSGHPWPVRLWGVDAPELDTALGLVAREFLFGLLEDQTVTCEKVVVDKFKRTVAKCTINGMGLSETLLSEGHAIEMCGFTKGSLGRC